MGQYFIVILLENTQSNKVLAWLYPSGCWKLGEHGYLGDDPVEKVESYLIPGASFYKRPLVWAGDSAKGEETDPKERTLYRIAHEDYGSRGLDLNPLRCVPFSAEQRARLQRAEKAMESSLEGYVYIVNHTLREYVNKYYGLKLDKETKEEEDGEGGKEEEEEEEEEGRMHPLAMLCNEGVEGSYEGVHNDKVGRWARHVISLEKEPPQGFTELKCKFDEY